MFQNNSRFIIGLQQTMVDVGGDLNDPDNRVIDMVNNDPRRLGTKTRNQPGYV